jgi:hypothetical protein
MHKKPVRDKKTGARIRHQSGSVAGHVAPQKIGKPKLINELLTNHSGLLRITAKLPVQQSWADWLRGAVAAELAGHIVSAVPKSAELVVFADSAAWGSRLRYALAAMQSDIAARDSAISHTTVRVQRQ